MKKFKKFCRMDQPSLKKYLRKLLENKYDEVVCEDGFLYAKGDGASPILLTAHMDTVHKELPKSIQTYENKEGNTVITSPQGIGGDDRCGVWIIYKILTETKYRPSILFCEDEEIGGVGSGKFVKTKYIEDFENLKYLLELDRANEFDAVYYDCGNEEFQQYIEDTTGYKEAYGSFSDIGHLSPECDKASVNLSCGYYQQHTKSEFVVYEEMRATKNVVITLLSDASDCPAFDYQEITYNSYKYNRYNNAWWDSGYDDYEYDYNGNSTSKTKEDAFFNDFPEDEWTYEFTFYTANGEQTYVVEALSQEEAVGMLMMKNPTICWNDVVDFHCY